jgi:hypothetical protein
LTACWRYEPRKHPKALAKTHLGILPSPLRDKVGYFQHDRFWGYLSVYFRSGLQPSYLRFAVTVTGHHARVVTQLLAKLYSGCHLRQLYFMRLQGATLTDLYITIACHTAPSTIPLENYYSQANAESNPSPLSLLLATT